MIARWLFKQFMRFQIFMYRRSGGKRFARVRGMPVLLLTTVGRKTGQQHVTPVMYLRDGETYVVTASNAGLDRQPAWFLNLQANPQAVVEVDGLARSATARQASPEQKSAPVAAVG
jgi:deazaflavin-dependent oxidoreductase (nitroreductase family)